MKGSKCKACGARDISGLMGPTPDWECGSYMREDGSIHQSDRCRAKELEPEQARPQVVRDAKGNMLLDITSKVRT